MTNKHSIKDIAQLISEQMDAEVKARNEQEAREFTGSQTFLGYCIYFTVALLIIGAIILVYLYGGNK